MLSVMSALVPDTTGVLVWDSVTKEGDFFDLIHRSDRQTQSLPPGLLYNGKTAGA